MSLAPPLPVQPPHWIRHYYLFPPMPAICPLSPGAASQRYVLPIAGVDLTMRIGGLPKCLDVNNSATAPGSPVVVREEEGSRGRGLGGGGGGQPRGGGTSPVVVREGGREGLRRLCGV
jgi:hypothetical protein